MRRGEGGKINEAWSCNNSLASITEA
jgi:hypothetical protein